jgi:hypothetical protein
LCGWAASSRPISPSRHGPAAAHGCGPLAQSLDQQDLRAQRGAGRRIERNSGRKLDPVDAPVKQAGEMVLHQPTLDQHDELFGAFAPAHQRRQGWRQQRSPGRGRFHHFRAAAHRRRSVQRHLKQKKTVETAGIDLDIGAIGDVVHRKTVVAGIVVDRMKIRRAALHRRQPMGAKDAADFHLRRGRIVRVDKAVAGQRQACGTDVHRHSPNRKGRTFGPSRPSK